jgi:hypothetical protein
MSTERNDLITTSSIDFEAPLGDNTNGKLVVISGVPRIRIGSEAAMPQLETTGYKEAANRYHFQISGSVSNLAIRAQVPVNPSGEGRPS